VTRSVRVNIPEIAVGNLFIERELAGETLDLGTRGEARVSLRFLSDIEPISGKDKSRRYAGGYVTSQDSAGNQIVSVGSVDIEVVLETQMDSLEGKGGKHEHTEEEWSEVERIRVAATEAAEGALGGFLRRAALVHGDFEARILEPLRPDLGIVYVGADSERMMFGSTRINVIMKSGRRGLSIAEADRISRAIVAKSEMSLGWRFFLDAFHELHHEGNVRHALISAATAMEMGVKEALTRKDPTSQLLPFILDRERIRELLTGVSGAVLGQSYSAANSAGFRLLMDLQTQRSASIHRRKVSPATKAEAEAELAAVLALLTWLDQMAP
jgi:hypothetical protein